MTIRTFLLDGDGKGNTLRINGEGEASVVVHPHPPKGEVENALPFRQYFTDTGVASGDNDMKVNGSTTNVEFSIKADQEKDLYIKTISVEIADASAALNKFGNLTALTNGLDFKWSSQKEGDITIADTLQTNWDFVRLAGGNPGFGDGAGAFRASNVSGTSEGYTPVLDLASIFGLAYGIRLRAGSTDELVFTVKDDVTGVDSFNIVGYGIKW
jgi:hypothetical protein